MARPRENVGVLLRLAGRAVGGYLGFVQATSRRVVEPADARGHLGPHAPAIIALWHGQFLLSSRMRPADIPLQIMLAKHGDAEVFAQALAGDEITLIRGAGAGQRQKDRGGAQALRMALRALNSGACVGMTADVPPGPARRAGEGIVTIAKLSGRPIIPMAVASRRFVVLNTWSRMTINLPFGQLAVVYGEPIYVPRDVDSGALEAYRLRVEQGLNDATARAYALAGSDPARATPPGKGDVVERTDKPGLGLRVYQWGTWLAQPVAPLILGYRERHGREDGKRRGERLGMASAARPPGTLVWVHAASVGETNAVLPLIDALRQKRPGVRFLLTTGTVTSAALAAKRLGPHDVHQFVPLDAPNFVRRFLDHWRPDLAIFTESEIWPNLVWFSAQRGIPLVLVNARISNRSFDRWKKLAKFSRDLIGRFDAVLAQNEKLARRFGELGAGNARAVGNLKMDAPPPMVDQEALSALKEAIGQRPVFLAASTHAGEELTVGAAHRRMVQSSPGLLTIIAPRHPERGTAIAEELKALGLKVSLRSTGLLPDALCDIYIADTIGELGTFYVLAPVAFIGGSLVEKGGQNPIEAIRHGAAVVMGPSWYNFPDACQTLLRHGGQVEVRDAGELASAVTLLMKDNVEVQRVRSGAQVALLTVAGALDESVATLCGFLPTVKELKRAS